MTAEASVVNDASLMRADHLPAGTAVAAAELAPAEPSCREVTFQRSAESRWQLCREAAQILGLAVPVALSNLFEYLPVLFLVAAIGHLPGSREGLAAAALGRNYFNSCWSIAWGFTSALHTLAPQAEGAGRGDLHALHCQRAALILTVLCIPLAALQVVSGSALRLLGQDAVVSAAAQPFAVRLVPRLFTEGYFTILQRVAQAMGHPSAVAAITALGCLGSVFFLWLFLSAFGLGYLGGAWACTAWNTLNMFALAIFLLTQPGRGRGRSLFTPYRPCQRVFAWSGFREYIALAVPSTLQACLEWWAIDLGVMLAAGALPDPDLNLGANAVVSAVADLCYMVWMGVQGATSIAVGKHVGAGQVEAARRSIRAAVVMGLLCASIVSLGLILGRHAIASALTTSPDVQTKAANVLLVLAVHVFADSTNCVLGGVLRGLGRQTRGVQFQFSGFYLVGFPVGALLLLRYRSTSVGLECLWIAVLCAAFTSALLAAVYISRADWEAILREACERNS